MRNAFAALGQIGGRDRPQPTAKAKVNPRPRTGRFLGGGFTTNSVDERPLRAPHRSTTVGAIIRRIASDTARPTWHFERTRPDGDTDQVHDHPLLNVLARPNVDMTPTWRALVFLSQQWLELTGETYLLVDSIGPRGQGRPQGFYPISPLSMEPVPADNGMFLKGWIHTAVDGKRTPLRPEEIIQIKYTDPENPYRGLAPIAAAMVEIDASELAAQYQRTFFDNSALPGGFVTTDESMTETEFDEWVERWDDQHAGVDNAFRIHLMDKGGKFIPQTTSLADMALTELIDSHRDTILEAWGMSRTMIGAAESETNRATAEAAEYVYGRYTLTDRLDLWAEAITLLGDRYPSLSAGPGRVSPWRAVSSYQLPADVESGTKDRDSRVAAAIAMIEAGADPASALAAYGLPQVDFAGAGIKTAEAAANVLQQIYLATDGKVIIDIPEARDLVNTVRPGTLTGPGPDPPAAGEQQQLPLDPPALTNGNRLPALNGHSG